MVEIYRFESGFFIYMNLLYYIVGCLSYFSQKYNSVYILLGDRIASGIIIPENQDSKKYDQYDKRQPVSEM